MLAVGLSTTQALAQSTTGIPAAATSPDSRQEGVKVHGDWTLTVRNPDGTLAGRYEFKNALAIGDGADTRLAQFLGGAAVPGKWTVTLLSPTVLCSTLNCAISESGTPHATSSKDLTKSVSGSGPDLGKLVLHGSVRVLQSGTITTVNTSLGFCAPAVSPDSCTSISGGHLTERTLPQAYPSFRTSLSKSKSSSASPSDTR